MKVLKENSEVEMKVQRVENLMRELDLLVTYTPNGLVLCHKDDWFIFTDLNSRDLITEFPRRYDGIRLEIQH